MTLVFSHQRNEMYDLDAAPLMGGSGRASEAPADAEVEGHVADPGSERGAAECWAVFLEAQRAARDAGLEKGRLANGSAGVGLPAEVPRVQVIFQAARGVRYPLPFLRLDHPAEVGTEADLVVAEVDVEQHRDVDVVHP